jgi:hypothetical protein
MKYTTTLETTAGVVQAHWTGGQYILVYWGDETPYAVIEIDFDESDPHLSRYSIERMALDVRSWFYEHERGIEIERITVTTGERLQ